jgi:hypothetical protein
MQGPAHAHASDLYFTHSQLDEEQPHRIVHDEDIELPTGILFDGKTALIGPTPQVLLHRQNSVRTQYGTAVGRWQHVHAHLHIQQTARTCSCDTYILARLQRRMWTRTSPRTCNIHCKHCVLALIRSRLWRNPSACIVT